MSETNDGLPVGWVEATIGDVSGRASTCRPDRKPDAEIVYIDISSIDNSRNEITEPKRYLGSDAPSRARQVVQEGDVLLSTVRVYLRNMAIVPHAHDGDVASTGFAVIRPKIEPRYLFYYVMTDGFVEALSECQRGSNYPAVRDKDVFHQRIPLPPLDEQRRIVAAVETLLSKTAAVTERLGRVPKTLRRFRQAVVSAACDGRLTADWRAANPDAEPVAVGLFNPTVDEPSGWQRVGLRALVSEIGQGWSPKCDVASAADGEWGVIKTTAVQAGQFVGAENKRLPDDLDPRVHLEIKKGDLLITRAGPRSRAGVACLVKSTRAKLMVCDKVYRIHLDEARAHPGYVELLLNEPEMVQSIDAIKTGTSDSGMNLTQGRFLDLEVALPPLAEQAEIVRRAEALLALADKVEARVAIAHRHAERTAQAVLAKAFRGDLVPTEASLATAEGCDFESGADLLARLRETPAAAPKRWGRPPKAAPLFE